MTVEHKKGHNFGLSVNSISQEALHVIKVLQESGYQSYIVGGGVRDLLLNKQPKDFDIATAAHPDKIRRLFKRCRLVGKRFRLAHVFHNGHMLEVATFRAGRSDKERKNLSVKKWCVIADNKYGTLEEDLMRRDFTINAMYYDPFADELICHPRALSDIKHKCLRVIGDPVHRYSEDPVRMLRGLRLAAKLGLKLERKAEAQIIPNRSLLLNIPPARMFEEFKKLFGCGASLQVFEELKRFRLFEVLFPQTADIMKTHPKTEAFGHFLKLLLRDTDTRIAASKPVTPAFTIAGLWWLPIYHSVGQRRGKRSNIAILRRRKINEIFKIQCSRIAIPRYLLRIIHEVYRLQPYLSSHSKRDINHLIQAKYFRASYDFFCLLSRAQLANVDDCKWWEKFQQVDQKQQDLMIADRTKRYSRGKTSRRPKVSEKC